MKNLPSAEQPGAATTADGGFSKYPGHGPDMSPHS
jgi:hypothetical protein